MIDYSDFETLGVGSIFLGTFSSGSLFYGIKIQADSDTGFVSLGSDYENEPKLPILRNRSALGSRNILDITSRIVLRVSTGIESIINIKYRETNKPGHIIHNSDGIFLTISSQYRKHCINLQSGLLTTTPDGEYAYTKWDLALVENDIIKRIVGYNTEEELVFYGDVMWDLKFKEIKTINE